MEKNLISSGLFAGTYDGEAADVVTNSLTIKLIDGITASLNCDKLRWINGSATFTAVLTNSAEKDIETPAFTAELDATLVNVVADSVTVNGTAHAFTFTDGLLTIGGLETITAGKSATITFQLEKV